MITLSWNCRGIGNPRTVRALHNLVQRYNPSTVFLMETKVGVKRMVKVKERIGLPNGLIIPSEGRSGGMALLWVRDLDVEIRSFSRYHIDAIVIDSKSGFKWRMTGFYGNPETSLRKESWSLLRYLNSQYQLPWMCLGDFNEIVSATEKSGGPDRAQQQMEGFREAIDTCGFQDMGFEGPEFTWCNQRLSEGRIQLRLDRVLASVEWAEHYQNARVYHIVEPASDHCAILLTDQQHPPIRRQRRFHFEEAWTKYEKCKEVIQEAWINYSGTQSTIGLVEGLNECAAGLSRWSRTDIGYYPRKIQEKRKSLQVLVQEDKDGNRGAEINELRKEINELLEEEEIRWHQRSRVQWYQKGDRNTQYFHHKASQRRKKNEIRGLWDKEGKWCEDVGGIASIAIEYFKELFSTSCPSRIEEVANLVPRSVTPEMNEQLTKEFQREEIIHAVHSMHPTKAPGPDGTYGFFSHSHGGLLSGLCEQQEIYK